MLEEQRYREWSRPREDTELDDLKVVTFDLAQITESHFYDFLGTHENLQIPCIPVTYFRKQEFYFFDMLLTFRCL